MGFTRGLGVKNTLSIGEAYNFKMADLEGMDLDLLDKIYQVVHNSKPCTVDGQDFLSLDRHRQIKINNEVVRVLNKANRQKKHQKTKALGIQKGSIRRINFSNGDTDIFICRGTFDVKGNMVWYSVDGRFRARTLPTSDIQEIDNEQEVLQNLINRIKEGERMYFGGVEEIKKILIQLKLIPKK
jgi:hypothetical protein